MGEGRTREEGREEAEEGRGRGGGEVAYQRRRRRRRRFPCLRAVPPALAVGRRAGESSRILGVLLLLAVGRRGGESCWLVQHLAEAEAQAIGSRTRRRRWPGRRRRGVGGGERGSTPLGFRVSSGARCVQWRMFPLGTREWSFFLVGPHLYQWRIWQYAPLICGLSMAHIVLCATDKGHISGAFLNMPHW